MPSPAEISREDFAALCRNLDLQLTAEEAERLREAYRELKTLLARLPGDAGFSAEPATVFCDPRTTLRR
jgi:vacuolar-type H+-ATPase catalytic subunit A/Vma1